MELFSRGIERMALFCVLPSKTHELTGIFCILKRKIVNEKYITANGNIWKKTWLKL